MSHHPFISVQCDWAECIKDSADFWISATKGDVTVEGKATCNQSNDQPVQNDQPAQSTEQPSSESSQQTDNQSIHQSTYRSQTDDFVITQKSPLNIAISCPQLAVQYDIQSADFTISSHDHANQSVDQSSQSYHRISPPSIYAIAVSPINPNQIIGGSANGSLVLYDFTGQTNNQSINQSKQTISPVVSPFEPLHGHVGDVELIEYFPSGVVVVTASLDETIKIWSISHAQNQSFNVKCVTTMTGHLQRISGVSLIDRGKTFLTSSYDSSIKLWDCSRSQSVNHFGFEPTIQTSTRAVNDVLLLNPSTNQSIEGSLVLGAYADGNIRGYDIRDPSLKPVMTIACSQSAAVTTLMQAGPDQIVAGMSNGHLLLLDVRSTSNLAISQSTNQSSWCREPNAAITKLIKYDDQSVIAGDELGDVTQWSYNQSIDHSDDQSTNQSSRIVREFSGIDLEPVRGLAGARVDGKLTSVVTASDAIRVYHV